MDMHESDEDIEIDAEILAQGRGKRITPAQRMEIALQEMPTFRGEPLNDKIPEEFDSEVTNSYDDEEVTPGAPKNVPVATASNVSPLPLAPIARSVTNLPAVTPVATEKNAPVDTASVVSPLPLAPLARIVTNLLAVKPVAKKKNAPVDTASNVSPLLIASIGPSVTNLPTPSIVPLQKVSNSPTGTTIIHLPPQLSSMLTSYLKAFLSS